MKMTTTAPPPPQKMSYSIDNYVEMVCLYFKNGENQRLTARIYNTLHPKSTQVTNTVIANAIKRFRLTGSVAKRVAQKKKTATSKDKAADVVAQALLDPSLSVRALAVQAGISAKSVQRILKENKMVKKVPPHHHHHHQQNQQMHQNNNNMQQIHHNIQVQQIQQNLQQIQQQQMQQQIDNNQQ